MKFDTILKSVMIAALFAGVAGADANAAQAKGKLGDTRCKELVVDLTDFAPGRSVSVGYSQCDDPEGAPPRAKQIYSGEKKPLQVKEDTGFDIEQCPSSNDCTAHGTLHIFPEGASGSMQNINNGWTVTCKELDKMCLGTRNKK
jgi:hypothetical protein